MCQPVALVCSSASTAPIYVTGVSKEVRRNIRKKLWRIQPIDCRPTNSSTYSRSDEPNPPYHPSRMRPLTTSALFVIWSSLPNTVMDACARMQEPGVVTTTAVPTTTAVAITTTYSFEDFQLSKPAQLYEEMRYGDSLFELCTNGSVADTDWTGTHKGCRDNHDCGTGCPVTPPGELPPDGVGCFGQANNPEYAWTYANCLSVTDNWGYTIADGTCAAGCKSLATFLTDGDLVYNVVMKCQGGDLFYAITGVTMDMFGAYNPPCSRAGKA
ncbi:unnamed protein product, partial [Mesorhabditis spiculigera]